MKKILIFYGSYGGGHLSAANSIGECIKENYADTEVQIIDCIKYVDRLINAISTAAYRGMAKKAPWAWKKVYYNSEKGTLAKISTASNKIMARKLNKLIKLNNPDLIISTHPFSNQMCGYLKKKGKLNCKIATVLTDYEIHNQWLVNSDYIDYFFVSHEGMKKSLIKKNIPENKIFVSGIPISKKFLSNFDRNEVFKNFELNPSKKTILFFAGGEFGLGKSKTYQILDVLINNFPDIQVIAVAGKNEKMKESFEKLVKDTNSFNRIKVLSYTKQVPELMSISNLVITKPGGLTTTESLVSGLPIIVINPIPGQEEQNAEFIEQNHLGIWLKKDDNIVNKLKFLLDSNENINNFKNNIVKFAKKDSTKNICQILLGV